MRKKKHGKTWEFSQSSERLRSIFYRPAWSLTKRAGFGRGKPEEIAGAVAFPASGEAFFIPGQTLSVPGGWKTR